MLPLWSSTFSGYTSSCNPTFTASQSLGRGLRSVSELAPLPSEHPTQLLTAWFHELQEGSEVGCARDVDDFGLSDISWEVDLAIVSEGRTLSFRKSRLVLGRLEAKVLQNILVPMTVVVMIRDLILVPIAIAARIFMHSLSTVNHCAWPKEQRARRSAKGHQAKQSA